MPKQIGNLTLYSIDDLHEQLGISKMTLRAYLREGRIRGRKLGVSWFVTEDAIREYFEGPQQSAENEKPTPQEQNPTSEQVEYKYVVQGINDLVSEEEECSTVEETIECLENQAIISLFQVAIRDAKTDKLIELVKARDFLNRFTGNQPPNPNQN